MELNKDELSTVSVCTCLKRLDTGGHPVQIQQIPRKKATTAEEEFMEIGLLSEAIVKANRGVPPLAYAYDNHLSFSIANSFFLGQLKPAEYADVPFFRECRPMQKDPNIPLFPFRTMVFRSEHPLHAVNDPKHVLKALSRQIRSHGRIVHMLLGTKPIQIKTNHNPFNSF